MMLVYNDINAKIWIMDLYILPGFCVVSISRLTYVIHVSNNWLHWSGYAVNTNIKRIA